MKKLILILIALCPVVGQAATRTITSLPYTFTPSMMTPGEIDTLLVTGNLHSGGNGISIESSTSTSVGHVVLIGTTDTIFFGEDGGSGYVGLSINGPANHRPYNVTVKGLIFKNNPPDPDSVDGVRGILMTGYLHTIENCNVTVRGWNRLSSSLDIQAMYLTGANTWGIRIINCVDSAIATGFRRRDQYLVCGIKASDLRAATTTSYAGEIDTFYHVRIIGCTIYSTHVGISLYGRNDPAHYHRSYVYGNSIKIDARNDNYLTEPYDPIFADIPEEHQGIGNAYCIATVYTTGGSVFRRNTLRAGTDHRGGEGMLIATSRNIVWDTIFVDSNDIDVHQGPDMYYGLAHRCQGINLRQNQLSNFMFRATTIFVTGDNDTATYHTGHNVVGLRWTPYGDSVKNNHWESCHIRVVGEPEAAESGGESTEAIAIAFDATHQGTPLPELFTRGNRIESNNMLVQYGYLNNGALSTTLSNDTLAFYGTTFSPTTFSLGWPNTASTDHTIRDAVFENGAGPEDIDDNSSNTTDLTIERTISVWVAGGSNNMPRSGATVTIINNLDDTVYTGTTSAGGLVTAPVTMVHASTSGIDTSLAQVLPLRLYASYDAATASNVAFYAGFNSADSANDTLTLAGVTGDGSWDDASPAISGIYPSGVTSYSFGDTIEPRFAVSDDNGLQYAFEFIMWNSFTDSFLVAGMYWFSGYPLSFADTGEFVLDDFSGTFYLRVHAADTSGQTSMQTSAANYVAPSDSNTAPVFTNITPSGVLMQALTAQAYSFSLTDDFGLDSAIGLVVSHPSGTVLDTLFRQTVSGGSATINGMYTPGVGDTGFIWIVGRAVDDSGAVTIDSCAAINYVNPQNPVAVHARGAVTIDRSAILRSDHTLEEVPNPSE